MARLRKMSNEEWETIETMSSQSLTEATWTIPMEYGYEYEARRRKKAEVMPEIDLWDSILLGNEYHLVTAHLNNYCRNIMGVERKFIDAHVNAIVRNGKEVWRRK